MLQPFLSYYSSCSGSTSSIPRHRKMSGRLGTSKKNLHPMLQIVVLGIIYGRGSSFFSLGEGWRCRMLGTNTAAYTEQLGAIWIAQGPGLHDRGGCSLALHIWELTLMPSHSRVFLVSALNMRAQTQQALCSLGHTVFLYPNPWHFLAGWRRSHSLLHPFQFLPWPGVISQCVYKHIALHAAGKGKQNV